MSNAEKTKLKQLTKDLYLHFALLKKDILAIEELLYEIGFENVPNLPDIKDASLFLYYEGEKKTNDLIRSLKLLT